MKPLRFEWDEDKAKSNLKKHKVSFEEAKTAFYDEYAAQFYPIARKISPFSAWMDSAGGVAALNPCFLRIIRLERPHNDLQSY